MHQWWHPGLVQINREGHYGRDGQIRTLSGSRALKFLAPPLHLCARLAATDTHNEQHKSSLWQPLEVFL